MAALFIAGLSLSPAHADQQVLERLLRELNLSPMLDEYQARLDRGQLVYGWPTQVRREDGRPNDWKPTETCWQTDNRVDVGRPNQEPRFLGLTPQRDLFSNDWFPDDFPAHTSPARRNLVREPRYQGLTN